MENNEVIITEEKEHLEKVQMIIKEQIDKVEEQLNTSKTDIINQKHYLLENLYEMDFGEIVSNRVTISEEFDSYETKADKKRLLLKLQNNTYFGRIDFVYDGDTEEDVQIMYIGLGGLRSKNGRKTIIFDWRAPVCSMYYDFDLGEAYYEAPIGYMKGKIVQKRQLKVRKGELEYVLSSDFKVDDEILQKELSENGSTKMRNIVATIQREQNVIIRDQGSTVMVVQGVAGSGKTSIALHRIAFLLYQNRKNLKSSEILIISPNSIFSDYISNVLPELGEQNISEVNFDEIAAHEMKEIRKFESKYQQMEYIITCKEENDNRLQRIRFKSGTLFLIEIKKFVSNLEGTLFSFSDYKLNDYIFKKDEIEKLFRITFTHMPIFERIDKIGDRLADIYESDKNIIVSVNFRNEIKQSLRSMAKITDIVQIYSQFIGQMSHKYDILEKDYISDDILFYEDVFPIVLLNFMLNGKEKSKFDRIKHVIVDEMQDYSMVQYEILNYLFQCRMTILGDINQVVDRENTTVLDTIQEIFGEKLTIVKMMKNYRSTYEIGDFCRRLCNLTDTEIFGRHGKKPVLEECDNYSHMIEMLQRKMDELDLSKITTMAIICKSSVAAHKLYQSLDAIYKGKCYLMNKEDDNFHEGILITNSYLIKGLEFDHVIVPEVTESEYHTKRDRQILYISCTRALHELDIFYYGNRSHLLDEAI